MRILCSEPPQPKKGTAPVCAFTAFCNCISVYVVVFDGRIPALTSNVRQETVDFGIGLVAYTARKS